ncbi:hypothetical protein FB45DRAFT_26845 [Roridomyces roridus]|uniref:Uncharacterized protein n=1 Tax=Roridomyces roridus TaxID=1738132 RepID=A0AAD7CKK4_9AGAR|nr:hypothetical protein FB45DRAFT_26845 [Roridomyces roridus]
MDSLSALVRVVFADVELVHAIVFLWAPCDNPSFWTECQLRLQTFIFAAAEREYRIQSRQVLYTNTYTDSEGFWIPNFSEAGRHGRRDCRC